MLKRLLTDSVSLVFGNLEMVFRATGAWFALQFLIMMIMRMSLGGGEQQATNSNAGALLVLVALVFSMAASASISVAWHRFGLLGELPGIIHLKFGRVELGFVLKMLLLALLLTSVWFVVILLHQIFGSPAVTGTAVILAFVFATPAFFRFSLILPGAAVEQRLGLGEAYAMSEGLGWTMFLATFLLSLPFVLGGLLLEHLVGLAATGLPLLLLQVKVMILNLLVQIIVTVLGISVLTAGYRIAMERQAQSPNPGVFQ